MSYEYDEYDLLDHEQGGEVERGFCPDCNKECIIIMVDMGIGPYEFWGASGRDVQMAAVTDCCHVAPADLEIEEDGGEY